MKLVILNILTLLVLSVQSQSIKYVGSGEDDGVNSFSTLRLAYEAANEGDTLFVYPGKYNSRDQANTLNLLIEKSITLIGAGYDHNINYDSLGYVSGGSEIDLLVTVQGVECFSSQGVIFTRVLRLLEVETAVIENSKIYGFDARQSGLIDLHSSLVISGLYSNGISVYLSENDQVSVSNSIIVSGPNEYSYFESSCGLVVLSRNSFYNSKSSVFSGVTVAHNNIEWYRNGICQSPQVIGSNNFIVRTSLSGSTPQCQVILQDSLINHSSSWNKFVDSSYIPKYPNYLLQLASDSTGVGPFSGLNPYRLSGSPSIPILLKVEPDRTGSSQSGIPVTINVKAID